MVAKKREGDDITRSVNFLQGDKQVHIIAAVRLHPKLQLHISRKLGLLAKLEFKLGILSFIVDVAYFILNFGSSFDRGFAKLSGTGV